MSIALVLATQAEGTVLIFEKMFESRLFFVDRLISMGAQIVLCDPHRAVVDRPLAAARRRNHQPRHPRRHGPHPGRALRRKGTSTVQNISQIDRGYERLEARLQAIGAHIRRVSRQGLGVRGWGLVCTHPLILSPQPPTPTPNPEL